MRKFLVPGFILYSATVFSQSNNLFNTGKLAEIRKKNPWMKSVQEKSFVPILLPPPAKTSAHQIAPDQQPGVLLLNNPATSKSNTDVANSYVMTIDNMPCIAPGSSFKSNMPVPGYDGRKMLPQANR